ncbi:MAG: MgtC/SapB family protein [Ruminococcaceae bacterium]|nr:MgtC/SapB family protein [Oscillospiraceae bacterium]
MFNPSQVISFSQINLIGTAWELLVRIVVAGVCGALIGLERGLRQKEAGIRTHCIVAIGAALLMIISKYGFADMGAGDVFFLGTKGADPTRVASQAITAIAFLGAGVIYRHGNVIKGLTTAAGVWATAAIGLCVGAGLYLLGVATAVLVLLINICLHKWLVSLESLATTVFTVTMNDTPEVMDRLRVQLADHKMQVQRMDVKRKGDGYIKANIVVRIPKNTALNDLLLFLNENEDVREFSVEV